MANRLALTIQRHCTERCRTQQSTGHDVRMACDGVDALRIPAKPGDSRLLANINMTSMEDISPLRQRRISG